MDIESFDDGDISRLPRAFDASQEPLRSYISSMVRNGPRSYIENANVRMEALLIDGRRKRILELSGADGRWQRRGIHEFLRR